MTKDFFEDLREFMIRENIKDACGYYHTIVQQKDKLLPILNDYEKYVFDFRYEETKDEGDGSSYYNPGDIQIILYKMNDNEECDYRDGPSHNYRISLLIDERYWGYCQCSENDKGFNYAHRCCGNGCDWVAPRVSISKSETLSYDSFQGVERDLWRLQEEWVGTTEVIEDKGKQEQLNYYDEMIEYWNKQKEEFLSGSL